MHKDMDDTLDHILYLARQLHGFEAEHIVKLILLELNFFSNGNGWAYLCDAIVTFRTDTRQSITKELYPTVAQHFGPGIKSRQVEKAIRTAIQKAWEQRDDAVWKRYFRVTNSGIIERPTNGEFISRIAATIDFWYACCQFCSRSDSEEGVHA